MAAMVRIRPRRTEVIPKSFSLMGLTYTVSLVKEKDWADDESVGFCNFEQQLISVFAGVSDAEKQQTFCHELVHCILNRMGEHDLNDNEKFVEVFGSLLHQVWTTIK